MKKHFTSLDTDQIDAENGIIRSVSLMEMGDAKGHYDKKGRQVIIDDVTLQQIFSACKKLGSIKVKADHGSGVFEIVGWADNFALKANKVCADIHIYEAEPNRKRLLEIADKNPTHMGISMEFTGEDKPSGTVSMSRCDAVYAAALVDDPAANSSLFSVPTTEKEQELETKTNNMDEEKQTEPTLTDLMAKFEEISTRLTALETPPEKEELETEKESDKELESGEKEKEDDKPEDKEDKDKVIELAAQRGAEIAIKAMSARLGITNLGKPGSITQAAKEKHFEEHVADLAIKEFSGDQSKARASILTNKGKHPDAWKAYEASRPVKTA